MGQAVVFYSDLCPDTRPFMAELNRYDLIYQPINITGSMQNLKAFLQVRDHREEFLNKKGLGQIGIPVLVTEEGYLIFDQTELGKQYRLKEGIG